MLTHRERASRFIGEPLQEPSACRHGVSDRVAIPDSSNAVLYSQSDSTTFLLEYLTLRVQWGAYLPSPTPLQAKPSALMKLLEPMLLTPRIVTTAGSALW